MFQEEMEIVFMVVFTTEMLTKILALGFMLHKGSYMRNPWNFMDFFVVTSADCLLLAGHAQPNVSHYKGIARQKDE